MADTTNQDAPEYSQKWWMKEIEASEKYLDEEWRNSADRVVNRYLDVRDDSGSIHDSSDSKRYNVFWANVQITKSALYATPPKPQVKRQYGDAKDDVARTAALILERCLQFGFSKDQSDMHDAFNMAIEDRLIPGLGQVWLRYDVTTAPTPPVVDPGTGQELAPAGMKITDEAVITDYVHWRDFLFSVCRTWGEVWWVGRRCWMKKKAFIKLFGQDKWKEIKDNAEGEKKVKGTTPKGFTKGRAEVFELWCEDTNRVYWVNRHLDALLKEQDDPLGLDDFLPCPKPILATHTTNKFIPRSDFTMVADQYDELDTLNDRISILTRALRVVGVYDQTQPEVGKVLSSGEFNMIPVDNWAALGEKGGLKGVVDWFPIEVISKVLSELNIQRQQVVAQIYELTSISDIMRGASNPRDTLGAQKLKAQYSSVRLQLNQQDVGKFVRHAMRIKCEIICRIWQPETIKRVSQIEFTESAQFADEAIALLKDYDATHYRIEVEEQTLSLADYNAERELRTEYITAIGQFLSQSAQMVAGMPGALPYLLKMIQWVTASFSGTSDIESVLDEAIQQAISNPPQQEGEDDGGKAAADAQAKAQAAQVAAQTAIQKAQMDNATRKEIAQGQQQTQVLIQQMKEGQEDKALAVEVTGIKADLQQSAAEIESREEIAEAQRAAAQQLQDTKPQPKKGGE